MMAFVLMGCVSPAGPEARQAAGPDEVATAAPVASEARPFGAFPLCEPSALLALDDGAILVADNEGRGPKGKKGNKGDAVPTLWVARPDGASPPVPVARDEVAQDAEALVRVGGELWVVGSLSRSKDCERRPRRWAIHAYDVLGFDAGGLGAPLALDRALTRSEEDIRLLESSVSDCQRLLFGGVEGSAAACAAIVDAASAPEGGPCPALNAEGAVAVDGRIWIGFRSPLVEGEALLARLAPDALQFDAVRTVDLQGRGIRELVVEGDRVAGIAGPVLDARDGETSALFSMPVAALGEGAPASPAIHDADLPADAEAVLLRPSRALYLLDGDLGADACEAPARLLERPRRPATDNEELR